ncbi:MAG: hypothetical protein PWP62_540 [Eubacteriaceae bacterium]|jgi:hypothetical protein|nr:hypothetical protein [Eubacteriaceae bacterium]MDK2960940.1 hypothetical protein [Eubacteriaceae bacterium]
MKNKVKKRRSLLMVLTICMIMLLVLTGCGESTPIEGMVISNEPYVSATEIEKTEQPEELSVGAAVYGSVSFIESPKGMKYQAKWLLNDQEIKTDEKAMETDKRGELIFPLEADKTTMGTLKLQILYKDEVLAEKEVLIK